MNVLKHEKKLAVLAALVEGNSIRATVLRAMVWLWIAYYNFCRIHGSIRVTPAMAAGITDHVWDLAELVA